MPRGPAGRAHHRLALAPALALLTGCPACPGVPVAYWGATVDPDALPADPLESLELAERWSRDGTAAVDKLNALVALDHAQALGADPFTTEVLRARAIFRLADENEDDPNRSAWVDRGIRAGEAAVAVRPDRSESHYYLGVLLGLRAETASIGALDDIPRIQHEARAAIDADPAIDDCGPLRLLGMLLVAAPPWPQSIGDLEYGTEILREAVECSDFPVNRILLAEALLDQGEIDEARELLRWVMSRPPTGRWGVAGNKWRPIAREMLERAEHPGRER